MFTLNNNMKPKLTIVILLIFAWNTIQAQDPIFTQYYFIPETINPSFSGFEEAAYFGVLHRTQWPNLDLRIETDYGFFNTWSEALNSGIGFSIMNQHESNTNYNFTQLNFNYAYKVQLTNDWYFRPSIEIGFGLKSFAFQNLVLADQININSGIINPTSVDPLLSNEKVYFFDFSAGVVFDKRSIRNDTDIWFGASIKHLNTPNISLIADGNVPLDIFYSIHANFRFPYFDNNKMQVSANFMQQGEFNRLDIGATMKVKQLFFGATAVTNPAKNSSNSHLLTSVNAFTGLEFEHFRFGLSYDFNTSKIGRTDGVYEISVTYLTLCRTCRRPTDNERRK